MNALDTESSRYKNSFFPEVFAQYSYNLIGIIQNLTHKSSLVFFFFSHSSNPLNSILTLIGFPILILAHLDSKLWVGNANREQLNQRIGDIEGFYILGWNITGRREHNRRKRKERGEKQRVNADRIQMKLQSLRVELLIDFGHLYIVRECGREVEIATMKKMI